MMRDKLAILVSVLLVAVILAASPSGAQTTSSIAEPPALSGDADKMSNKNSTRVNPEKLKRKIKQLDKELRAVDKAIGLGHDASNEWKKTAKETELLVEDFQKQQAACRVAVLSLEARIERGTPEKNLWRQRKHVKQCVQDANFMRGLVAAIKTDVDKLLQDVNWVTEEIQALAQQKTEQTLKRGVLQRVLGNGIGEVKSKIKKYDNFKGY